MAKDKLSRKLKDFLKFQKKENRARKNQEYFDLFGCIGPVYYDTLVEQWLTQEELSEFLGELASEQIRTLFKHLSDSTFYFHILKNFSELDLEFGIIADERMSRFFKDYGNDDFFAYMFLQIPKHISEKIRLFELYDKAYYQGVEKWLIGIFCTKANQDEERKDFFEFIEELVGSSSRKEAMEYVFERIISTVSPGILKEIILVDKNAVFTSEIMRRLDGTEKFYSVFENIYDTDEWFSIIEKVGYTNFANLKGKSNIVEVFKDKPDELYDLFANFYENFWLFFTLEDVVAIYRAFTTDEVVYEDFRATILYGVKNYSEDAGQSYLEFYSLLSENERLHLLKNMTELSDEMLEIAEYILRAQESLSFYEDLLLKHLEAEAKNVTN